MCSIGFFLFCIASPLQWKVFFFKSHCRLFTGGQLEVDQHCSMKWFDAVMMPNPWRHMASIDPNMSKLVIDNIAAQGTSCYFIYLCLPQFFSSSRIFTTLVCPLRMKSNNLAWWRHQVERFSALLAICAGNSPVTGEFPAQMSVTRSLDVLLGLRPNKRFSKQWWCWWFEAPSCQLWRYCNGYSDTKVLQSLFGLLMTTVASFIY